MYYDRKRIGIIRDFWFENERNKEKEIGADFTQYHDMRSVPKDGTGLMILQERQTLLTSLMEEPDVIMSHFKKNTKYEIRRADKEGCYAKTFTSDDLLKDGSILRRIDAAHAQMYSDKGKKSKSEYPVMLAAVKADMLRATVGFLPDGRECAYHVYIVGDNRARLLHSISVFREVETGEEKNAIGRLNRFLHYKDMLDLKEQGYREYDWGGYSEKEHLKTISEFKASFGGDITDVYTAIYASSLIGKLTSRAIEIIKFKG